MSNIAEYDELLAFHPGSYIEDIIEDLNITQEEFASRLGISAKLLSNLVHGEVRLTPEVALKLERLTGVDYATWMNLQNSFDKKKIEIEKRAQEDEYVIVNSIDISYFKKHGFIKNKRYSSEEKITELRTMLNVANLGYLRQFNAAVSYRNMQGFEDKTIINSNIMLEIASNMARSRTDCKLNRKKLKEYLPEIKQMATEKEEDFFPELQRILLDCGVVLVGLPHLTNSNLQGATKRFKNGSVLLLITDRNKSADIFWFSLMHEIAHIIDNDFYTDQNYEDEYLEKERKADNWAAKFFIPPEKYQSFVDDRNFSKAALIRFSEEMEIPVWILTGRLKKDKYIDYPEFTEFDVRYEITFA